MSLSAVPSQSTMSSRPQRRNPASGLSTRGRPKEDPLPLSSEESESGEELEEQEEQPDTNEQEGSDTDSPVVDDRSVSAEPPIGQPPTPAAAAAEEDASELLHLRRELKEIDRHFSKIAARFTFSNDVKSYSAWVNFFRAEMESCDLADQLHELEDAGAKGDSLGARLKQKTLYHMILQCVPEEARTALTTALPASERTGAGAWEALRKLYIGDKRAHLEGLEQRFSRMRWLESEEFTAFEVRYESLLSELESAGVAKLDHVKRSGLMRAVEESSKHDARGVHVFDRLNIISKIHAEKSYREWMLHLRNEAQQIAEALKGRRGTKRPAAAESHMALGEQPGLMDTQVSFVQSSLPPAPFSRNQHKPWQLQSGGGRGRAPMCRNMRFTGRCDYGSACKFRHDAAATPNAEPMDGASDHQGQRRFKAAGPGGGEKRARTNSSQPCWQFMATRQCARGDSCRFVHQRDGYPRRERDARPDGAASGVNQMDADLYALSMASPPTAQSHVHRVIADSGAALCISPRRDFIRNMRVLPSPVSVSGAFGAPGMATHVGEGRIPLGEGRHLIIDQLFYCAELRDTLLSYVQLQSQGHRIHMEGLRGTLKDKFGSFEVPITAERNVLLIGTMEKDGTGMQPKREDSDDASNSYPCALPLTRAAAQREQVAMQEATSGPDTSAHPSRPMTAPPAPSATPTAVAPTAVLAPASPSNQLAHARYGHLGEKKLRQLVECKAALGMLLVRLSTAGSSGAILGTCDACMESKMARVKFAEKMRHEAGRPNDSVVGDVLGPVFIQRHADGSHTKYYLSTLIDVWSRQLNGRIIDSKDKASDHVISYFHSAVVLTGNPLRHFHTDGGTEYLKAARVLTQRGVKNTRTPVDTPQRNAIAERKNRTILEMARALLRHAHLSYAIYWMDAIQTAIYLHNRVTVVNPQGLTSHELYTGHRPDLSNLRVFGCDAFVRVPGDVKRLGKFDMRAIKGIFVGYDQNREFCWRVRIRDADGSARVIVSRDVRFCEEEFTVEREKSAGNAPAAMSPPASANGIASTATARKRRRSRGSAESDKEERAEPQLRPRESEEGPPLLRTADEKGSHPSAASARCKEQLNSDCESDMDPISASESEAEENLVEKRTLAKIKAAERKEAEVAAHQQSHNRQRSSKRAKVAVKQTGLNLDDFGRVAWQVSADRASVLHVSAPLAAAASATSTSLPLLRQSDVPIPSTRRAAMRSPFAPYWQAAMDSEIGSIRSHGTYVVMQRPAEQINIVGCKWVFATKCKDGVVSRFKARLVARGFSQQWGVDYEETYSPVLKYMTLRVLLSIIAVRDYNLELMDVQTAYLNADLKETVYMQQPEGYEEGGPSAVCWLRKALYGLKQAGREWNLHLDSFVCSLGFTRCVADTCLYIRRSRTHRPILLSVYVDDIPSAFAPEDAAEWQEIKDAFFRRFKITFLGEADWLLNIRITRDRARKMIFLEQRAYVENMLEELQMDECKTAATPAAQDRLSKDQCPATPAELEAMKGIPYRRAVGLLSYLSNITRPDIRHAVHSVAQFAQNPGPAHWRAVKQILRYLAGTAHLGLRFDGRVSSSVSASSDSDLQLPSIRAYADADWAGCPDSRRSTSGWLLWLGQGCLLDWSCKRQETVALSSCEAEYMAMASAVQAVCWARNLLSELGLSPPSTQGEAATTALICGDNKSAIAMSRNDVHHSRSKHIDLRYHFIRDEIRSGRVQVEWVPSDRQLADILTKPLPPRVFSRLRDQLVFSQPSHSLAPVAPDGVLHAEASLVSGDPLGEGFNHLQRGVHFSAGFPTYMHASQREAGGGGARSSVPPATEARARHPTLHTQMA